MRALVQRVSQSRVEVDSEVVGQIGAGLLILLGVGQGDSLREAHWLAEKIAHLRIFPDPEGKLNLSLVDTGGEALVVSQFTLFGDCRKGRRPSFVEAARPEMAVELYEAFAQRMESLVYRVARGVFQTHMDVHLVNDGPVTLWLDTDELCRAQ